MKNILLSALLCAAFSATHATAQNLLPLPQRFEKAKGAATVKAPETKPLITDQTTLQSVAQGRYTQASEAYSLTITPDGINGKWDNPLGEFRMQQTLAQLRDDKGNLPLCTIEDSPAYYWRGAMLDVSRHFFSLDFVKKQIDVLAQYKINRLHLHLTDAAGWRMEIKRYPRLTGLGAFRTFDSWKTWWDGRKEFGGVNDPLRRKYVEEGSADAHGGYYTQQQLRELVQYAAQRGITIVPEIEMPAHSEETLTAYPELSCTHEPYKQADFCPGNVATYDFLEHVLEEVMDVFPSVYIHVGGDEAAKASWAACPRCQQKMHELGIWHPNAEGTLANGEQLHKLQAHLIAHMGDFLQSHGRKLIGWDEVIDENLSKNTTVMVWRNADFAADAVRNGYDVILSPGSHCYLDGYQDAPNLEPEAMGGFTPLEKVYGFVPGEALTPEQRAKHVKGVQGNLWTEYVPTEAQVEHMFYPRMLALAEIGWNGTATKDYPAFRKRALAEVEALRARGVMAFDLAHEIGDRKEFTTPIRHKASGAKVTYAPEAPYNTTAYAAAGDASLTDGLRGSWSYGDHRWQGFIGGKDYRFDVTLDLGRKTSFSSVATDFMQMCGPEIFYPADYVVSISDDGENFRELGRMHRDSEKTVNPDVMTFSVSKKAKARYIRVQATASAFGGWLFADEVVVK
ncbi:MAG: family 20 glycosylhydrolase [Bacteroidales bacterium]|nr:family 20 glycosylhydrolase [Bacteroidales bacterium]